MENSKVVLYIAVSLDGYTARSDVSVDWLLASKAMAGTTGMRSFTITSAR